MGRKWLRSFLPCIRLPLLVCFSHCLNASSQPTQETTNVSSYPSLPTPKTLPPMPRHQRPIEISLANTCVRILRTDTTLGEWHHGISPSFEHRTQMRRHLEGLAISGITLEFRIRTQVLGNAAGRRKRQSWPTGVKQRQDFHPKPRMAVVLPSTRCAI